MSSTTLHKLLSGTNTWNEGRQSNAEDYLERHCTIREFIQLYEVAGVGKLVPKESDKCILAMELCGLITPKQLLQAWDKLLIGRAKRKQTRTAATDAQPPDTHLQLLLRELTAPEIAALYLGTRHMGKTVWQQQFIAKPPRGLPTKLELSTLRKMYLHNGLKWLATTDPDKAARVLAELTEFEEPLAKDAEGYLRA